MAMKTVNKALTPEALLQSYIDRLAPKDQKLFRALRAAIRKLFPTANELGYDYTSHVVISYSPTEHAIDALLAIDARPEGVRLYLMSGPKLPDPKKLLMGSGAQARFLHLESARTLAHPDVKALIAAAVDCMKIPLPSTGKGRLLMRGSTEKQRTQRRAAARVR